MRDQDKSKEQLIQELSELRVCHARLKGSEHERERLEHTLQDQTHRLQERVKELQCLYGISELVTAPENSPENIFQGIVELIPPAWQYPDITCARLTIDNQSYCTENFQDTLWKQIVPILVQGEQKGLLEVGYIEEKSVIDEGPFLLEEHALLNVITERLGKVLEYRHIQTELQQHRQQLEKMVNVRTAELINMNAQLECEIAECKRTEEELRRSEGRLRQITYLARLGIWDWEIATDEAIWNDEMFRIYGILPEEFSGKGQDYFEFTLPEDREIQQKNIRKAFKKAITHYRETGETSQIEPDPQGFRLMRPDGTICHVMGDAVTIVDETAQPARMLGILRDITELKRAEDALRESEARYRTLVESSSDHIFILNREGIYLSSNSRVMHLEFPEEQSLVGLGLDDVYGPELAEYYHQKLSQVFVSGQAITFEHSIPGPDGERHHIDTLYPLKKGAEIWAVGGICRDMTERKRAEEVLQKNEQKYRHLVETLQEGIWVIDAQAYTTFVNPRMAEMLGYTVEEMLGKHLFEFMDEQGVRIAQRNLDRRQQGITEQHDFEFLRKDGSRIYTNIEASPILDEHGKYAGAIAGVADMTERRMAEEQIKVSLKEKELLLQEIHHRVKNNLQVIASLLYLQSRHIHDAQLQQQFLESRNRVRSMALVHETLYQSKDLTHIDFAVYIRGLIAQVFRSYREQAQHIASTIHVQNVSLSIEAATPCGLIINELVSNALRHAFPNNAGELDVTFEMNQDRNYILTVNDTGIGLPANFDVQKAESLGIKLVSSLVDQLDGTLYIDTDNGTTFMIIFPEPEYTRRI